MIVKVEIPVLAEIIKIKHNGKRSDPRPYTLRIPLMSAGTVEVKNVSAEELLKLRDDIENAVEFPDYV